MDLDGDGNADIFWRNSTLQQADWWMMRGAQRLGVRSRGVAAQYRVAAIADFSGDGRSDVLWEDGSTIWLWRAEPAGEFSIHFVDQYPAGGWVIAGAGDLNADGKADIAWSNRTRQQADWWYMDGPLRVGVGSSWWHRINRSRGCVQRDGLETSCGGRTSGVCAATLRRETVLAIGGYPHGYCLSLALATSMARRGDIFERRRPRSDGVYGRGDPVGATGTSVDARYSVAAIADYSGDGRADVLWQDGQTLWIWRAEPQGGFSVQFVDQYPQGGWVIAR